jgi:hypothetical protein
MQPNNDSTQPLRRAAAREHSALIEGFSANLLPARYRLEGEVARGGMGLIVRVRDQVLDRSLALKVLQERYHGRPDMVLGSSFGKFRQASGSVAAAVRGRLPLLWLGSLQARTSPLQGRGIP